MLERGQCIYVASICIYVASAPQARQNRRCVCRRNVFFLAYFFFRVIIPACLSRIAFIAVLSVSLFRSSSRRPVRSSRAVRRSAGLSSPVSFAFCAARLHSISLLPPAMSPSPRFRGVRPVCLSGRMDLLCPVCRSGRKCQEVQLHLRAVLRYLARNKVWPRTRGARQK